MQQLTLLKIDSKGDLVTAWQQYLTGKGFYHAGVNGNFDDATKAATISFQQAHSLEPDGIVGNKTFGAAMREGFEGVADERTDTAGAGFPPRPSFPSLNGLKERQDVFGVFTFEPALVSGNPEHIRITNNWVKENIVEVAVPQLLRIRNSDKMPFHKKAAKQLQKLWADWEQADLLHLILTWDGSYEPRFIRGGAARQILSNHAFGSAFDINARWNDMGSQPALVGQKGSVRELVSIANGNGFFWGGHFLTRPDGMHFEIAKIVT